MGAEQVRGMVSTAVWKLARDKLVAALGDPAVTNTMRGNMGSELEKMKDEMHNISSAVLEDAEKQSTSEKLVQVWLQQLEGVAYNIWDFADEIRTNNKDAAPMSGMLPRSAVTIQVMTQRLHEIIKRRLRYNLIKNWYDEEELYGKRPPTSADLDHEAMVAGRDEQVERILDFLLSPAAAEGGMSDDGIREWLVFLPIFGLAGVGKTTLAKLVYNHPRSLDCFDARAWVYVLPNFDLRRIGKSIIYGLTNATYDDDLDLDSIRQRIHELFSGGRKVLLVLDDICNCTQDDLDGLKSLLGAGNQEAGSKVVVNMIITTRDEDIARRICTNKLVQPYKLHPLSDDQCLEVFKRASRFDDRSDKQYLDKIVWEIIATKCGGVPLAAKLFGEWLWEWGLTYGEPWAFESTDALWMEFVKWSMDSPKNTLLSTLSLSYQSMEPNVRLCFAYLGTLSDRHNMTQDDIIHRWIALGLIDGISTGHQIISRLVDLSFLQLSNLASTTRKHDDKDVVSFTMHSLVHEFARFVMIISNVFFVAYGEDRMDDATNCCRYAVWTNVDLAPSAKLSGILPAELRSLSLLGCSKMELSNDSFAFAKYLKVLELREPSMQKLPDSISQLGLLGYLNLSSCSALVQLPESFGNLTSLLHINLSGCTGLLKLPESFGKLTSLLHINLSDCSGIVKLQDSFGNLRSLLHINLSGCCGLVKLPESFGNLTSVLHINLSGCSGLKNLPKSIVNLTSVKHISFSGCHGLDDLPKSFCKLSNLEYLDLSFCSCLRELHTALDGLSNLRHLDLSHPSCYALEHRDHLEQLKDVWAKLKKLQYLNLSMFTNPIFCNLPEEKSSLDCLQSIFKGLSSLEHLDLSHNIFLVDIPETLCALSKLHTLNLSGCIRLKRIAKKITEMKFLRTIILRKCPSLESYSFVVHADEGAYRSNLVQLEDIERCKELEISCLEKVKSVEDAKRITLDKKRLEKLTLGWTGGCHVSSVDDEALLEESVPPQNLQSLALKGYGGNSLPTWLTSNLCLHLPNLEELTMENLPKCHTLPSLLLLPKLKQVVVRKMASITKLNAGELSGGSRAELHQLVQFTIDDMENLQEFNTIYCSGSEESMFPTIDELVIQSCPNLKFGPFLPTAQRLQISSCDKLMSSLPKREAGEHGKGVDASSSSTSAVAAPRVTQLVVENCKVPLGEWSLLYHLPGLRSLEIRGCNDLTGAQEIIQALSSLQSLRFYQCNGINSLLEYLGELTSLQELTIDRCQDIESLPSNIDKLSNLKDLRIPGCPKLVQWCKSADNKQKLAHIQIRESATVETSTAANQTANKQLTRGQSRLLVRSQ